MGKSQSRLRFKSRFEHFWGVIRQFKDLIRQPNHCWLLLISPFQCLVVSPVELTGFHWFRLTDVRVTVTQTLRDAIE